ncbi:MAG TPA: glycoside hydrolase family 3 C-terminal domain-containing protein [Pseudonocardiaceae bacterium]|nr:glycoside hydrolase family 3 C-terminal domain-containing protein [Pseudonocardiaceae bacterium]
MVSDVAAANPNTVVVVNSGSAVTMPWANSVKGIIENWYPGQEDGNAIAALLFGDVNFSGKLPVTFPQSLAQVPASTTAQWPGQNGQVQYSEGVDVGYRWYDSQHLTPLFPFGFGLSYTTFGFSGLTVSGPDSNGNVTVGFTVTNTGSVAGSEVAQVYVGEPASSGEPPNSLRGFQRVTLDPGQSQQVSVVLDQQSFQYWANNSWVDAAGTNTISVGSSSRDLPLTGAVNIPAGTVPPPANVNLALGKTMSASGSTQNYPPGNADDGDTSSYWESTDNAFPQWLQVDLGSVSTVGRIVLTLPPSTAWGARTQTLSVLGSTDGSNFSTLVGSAGYTFDPNNGGNTVTITVPSTNTRYLRLNFTGNTGWPAGQVSEFQVYGS